MQLQPDSTSLLNHIVVHGWHRIYALAAEIESLSMSPNPVDFIMFKHRATGNQGHTNPYECAAAPRGPYSEPGRFTLGDFAVQRIHPKHWKRPVPIVKVVVFNRNLNFMAPVAGSDRIPKGIPIGIGDPGNYTAIRFRIPIVHRLNFQGGLRVAVQVDRSRQRCLSEIVACSAHINHDRVIERMAGTNPVPDRITFRDTCINRLDGNPGQFIGNVVVLDNDPRIRHGIPGNGIQVAILKCRKYPATPFNHPVVHCRNADNGFGPAAKINRRWQFLIREIVTAGGQGEIDMAEERQR